MKIVFLDVGQGDAILVSQGGNQMLIDGGRSGKVVLNQLGKYMPFWDDTIEAVVATHPDEDHIGGLNEVIEKYHVQTMIDTRMQSKTLAYQALQQAKKSAYATDIEAISGMKITFPDASVFEVKYPNVSYEGFDRKDTNSTSIVMQLTTKSGKTFLFTGDLPSTKEDELHVGHIDVLKAGHHGSKYSSSSNFLDTITPQDVILSVGAHNRYGHPADEVLQRVDQHHARIFRTDTQGSILYICNENCTVRTER